MTLAPGKLAKDALLSALVTFGLAMPIIAYRTEPDPLNRLVLTERWGLVATLCFAAALLRVALELWTARKPAPGTAKPARDRAILPPEWKQHLNKAGLALLLLYPFLALLLTGTQGSIKWIESFGIQILLYILLGWGLNIVVGLAGLLDLGFVAFYAVGAYSTALLTKAAGLSFWIALPLAGIFASLWGVLIGLPVLRLRGDYLAIVTLAFAEILRIVITNWVPVTGGAAGISEIPKPTFFGLTFSPGPWNFATVLGLPPSPIYRIFFLFYLAVGLALLAYWVTKRMRKLPIGRAWEALREDEIACRSLGINTVKAKLSAFAARAPFLVGSPAPSSPRSRASSARSRSSSIGKRTSSWRLLSCSAAWAARSRHRHRGCTAMIIRHRAFARALLPQGGVRPRFRGDANTV